MEDLLLFLSDIMVEGRHCSGENHRGKVLSDWFLQSKSELVI